MPVDRLTYVSAEAFLVLVLTVIRNCGFETLEYQLVKDAFSPGVLRIQALMLALRPSNVSLLHAATGPVEWM